jgi:hypothetical protein
MNVYRFSVPAFVVIEVVADDADAARAIAAGHSESEAYPEIDLEEGALDGSGRVTITTVTVNGEPIAF